MLGLERRGREEQEFKAILGDNITSWETHTHTERERTRERVYFLLLLLEVAMAMTFADGARNLEGMPHRN